MNTSIIPSRNESGMVLLVAMIAITALVVMAASLTSLAIQSTTATASVENRQQALFLAQSGLAQAFNEMAANRDLDGDGTIGAINSYGGTAAYVTKKWGQQQYFYVLKTPYTDSSNNVVANQYFLDAYGTVSRELVGSTTDQVRHIRAVVALQPGSPTGGFPAGAFGKASLTVVGNYSSDSFNSQGAQIGTDASGNPIYATIAYDSTKKGNNGSVGSNGNVSLDNNNGIMGSASAGGTVSGTPSVGVVTNNAPQVNLPDPTQMCTVPTTGLTATLTSCPSTLGAANTTTTYYLKGSDLSNVTISGNCTIYLDGALTGSITVASGSFVKVFQTATGTGGVSFSGNGSGITIQTDGSTGGQFSNPNVNQFMFVSASTASEKWEGNSDVWATVYAPFADMSAGGNGVKYGAFIGNSLSLKGGGNNSNKAAGANFHFDQNSQSPGFATTGGPILLAENEIVY